MEDNNNSEYQKQITEKLSRGFKKEQKSWLGFFIKNYRFTYLIIFAIIVFGFFSMATLPKESEPEIKVPYGMINTVYIGASPTDVENAVTNKIEEKVKNLENLHEFSSTSSLGFSSVFVEFEVEADLQESFRKLREAADAAKPNLPDEANDPVATEIRMSDYPIVTYSLIGNYSDAELKKYADILEEKLEGVKDVSKAEIIGGLEREFQVIVDQTKLASFNLSLNQVVSAISSNNFNLPAGIIEIDDFRYSVRIKGKINEAKDLNNLVIATYNNSPVFLRDIALIKDGFKEKSSESRIGYPNIAPQNTISLQIYKKTGGNILNIVNNSQIAIEELQNSNTLPIELKIEKTNDNSIYIKDDLRILGTSAIQTFILIALILLAILSFRGAIITALAVPIAFLMSFMFLKFQGMSINSMVLFSLVLSLGLMVDNAIVIIEGINEYAEKHKQSVYKSAILSIWNFKSAITAGTLTTVAAFLPMLLVSGIMGEYMSIIPKTLVVTLLSSLFVALIIIPTLVTRFIKPKTNGDGSNRNKKRHVMIKNVMDKLAVNYRKTLSKILPHRKKRRSVIIVAWLLFFITVAIPASGMMRIQMFPKIDFDYFYVNVTLPVGSSLEKTKTITAQAEQIVNGIPELENYVTSIGTQMSTINSFSSGNGAHHKSSVIVNLKEAKKRDRSSIEITESIRDDMEAIQGAVITVEELEAGPPSGSPVEVRVFSENGKDLARAVKTIKDYFSEQAGIININTSLTDATGEFTFTIDKQKANYYGLSTTMIAGTVRNALFGTTASTVNLDNEDIDITVKYAEEKFNDINDLKELLIVNPAGQSVLLKQVADVKIEPSLLSIAHRDGKQIATITAGIEKGVNLQKVTKSFLEMQATMEIPKGMSIETGGEVEDVEKSFREMFYSMIVAVLLIATILILQFNSFKKPFIILFSLPLAIIGVIWGLIFLNMSFSITVFVGIVSLSGIVVNDAIVLLDRINKNIKDGLPFEEAIIEGGIARMQPIIITSITTIAGIIPLIYASEMWRGLSIAIIFGLLFSTFLNLIFVPILYASMCKKEDTRRQAKLQ